MAFAQCLVAASVEPSTTIAAKPHLFSSSSPNPPSLSSASPSFSFKAFPQKPFLFARPLGLRHQGKFVESRLNGKILLPPSNTKRPFCFLNNKFRRFYNSFAKAQPQESEVSVAAEAFTHFKHLLLPITDRNPYLSEGTRQAAATTAALAKKYGADITVVVIDEQQKESLPQHETQLASVRWHLSEGGFQEFKLLERLGEGSKPTAIIGDVADEMRLDLVIMSMEAIHSKHVDANLLAEFIPCPVLLLPL